MLLLRFKSSGVIELNNGSRQHEWMGLKVVGAREWIINNHIAQYSARLIIKDKNRIELEVLGFYDYFDQSTKSLLSQVAFLVVFPSGTRIFLPIRNAHSINTLIKLKNVRRLLFKIRSETIQINIDFANQISGLFFLLTEKNEFEKLIKTYPDQIDKLLRFQRPFVYDSRTKTRKTPAIAHCLHNMNYMKREHVYELKNWLFIQEKIGIDRIKLYFSKITESQKDEIKIWAQKNLETMKVDFVGFR